MILSDSSRSAKRFTLLSDGTSQWMLKSPTIAKRVVVNAWCSMKPVNSTRKSAYECLFFFDGCGRYNYDNKLHRVPRLWNINIHEFERFHIITSIDNHLETRSVSKANTTTKATFPRQKYKLIVGGSFVVLLSFSPMFNHVHFSHVIRKNIGFVANWAGVDDAEFGRHATRLLALLLMAGDTGDTTMSTSTSTPGSLWSIDGDGVTDTHVKLSTLTVSLIHT